MHASLVRSSVFFFLQFSREPYLLNISPGKIVSDMEVSIYEKVGVVKPVGTAGLLARGRRCMVEWMYGKVSAVTHLQAVGETRCRWGERSVTSACTLMEREMPSRQEQALTSILLAL